MFVRPCCTRQYHDRNRAFIYEKARLFSLNLKIQNFRFFPQQIFLYTFKYLKWKKTIFKKRLDRKHTENAMGNFFYIFDSFSYDIFFFQFFLFNFCFCATQKYFKIFNRFFFWKFIILLRNRKIEWFYVVFNGKLTK